MAPKARLTSMHATGAKRSITADFSKPEDLELIHDLVRQSDVLIENFKVGGLAKYGLDYESLKKINPKLILLLSDRFRPERAICTPCRL